MKENLRDYLYYYGYADHPEEGMADPNTTFFEYGDQHDAEKLEQLYMGYKKCNAEALGREYNPAATFAFNESFPC